MAELVLDRTELEGNYSISDHLWRQNHPKYFWQVIDPSDDLPWDEAIRLAIIANRISSDPIDINQFLSLTLGEGRYGRDHWGLSLVNRFYWGLKPIVPRWIVQQVRSVVNRTKRQMNHPVWPIDDRYVCFLMDVLLNLMKLQNIYHLRIKSFWPEQKRFALVLTHDVETPSGQDLIPKIMELEEMFGFHSSFNIVGNHIPVDTRYISEMCTRGFEIGLHGWRHDAIPFKSKTDFQKYARKMNEVIHRFDIHGHRSPLNLRNPDWMQSLDIEYDLSFFDTDPYEPIPGGAMSIWPYTIGHFMELPATLVQDNTLFNMLRESSPDIWFKKVEYLRKFHGMALLNSHPENLHDPKIWLNYARFLEEMAQYQDCWNPLPVDAASWWRKRMDDSNSSSVDYLLVERKGNQISLDWK